MQRSVLVFALLTVSILVVAPAQAQRAGGGARVSVSGGAHSGSGHGFPNGPARGYSRYRNYGGFYAPWYYPDWGWDLGPSDSYGEPPAQSPPVIVMQSRDDNREPARLPESPKLIELPDTKDAAAKPDLPTLFVFTNGERLEARRYTLTPNSLHVEIDRQQRSIALDQLNLKATIAANRDRGIDLKFPTDASQLFLGF
jgi:hypothetical protein